ncbi:UNVERIFIED_CONTAM: Amyloid beta A4 precursor protein-binding family B member 2 [Trichonephila clavipes]
MLINGKGLNTHPCVRYSRYSTALIIRHRHDRVNAGKSIFLIMGAIGGKGKKGYTRNITVWESPIIKVLAEVVAEWEGKSLSRELAVKSFKIKKSWSTTTEDWSCRGAMHVNLSRAQTSSRRWCETELLSYANPNYQLTSSDENCNVEVDGSYDDLYEGLDVACRVNRRLSIRGRRKYASLDPVSMGVDVDLETIPMLTESTENNLNQTQGLKSSDREESFQGNDNGNSVFDSNDNKDMGKKSSFLDYYISLEAAASLKENKSTFQAVCNCDSSVEKPSGSVEKLTGSTNYDKLSCNETADNDCLPSGWERHEDDSGPYYWHISSGTIQRDPPISYSCNRVSSRASKDLELSSSKKDLYLNPRKTSCENGVPNGIHAGNVLGMHSVDDKIKRRSCPDGSCSLTPDKRPIRFAVRSLGWVEIAEADLTPERSSKAVNKCIVDLSVGRNDILDIVGRWGDGKDLFMDLDDYSLRLMDTQDLTVLNTQPIHTIRVWGVGRDNGRLVEQFMITYNLKCKEILHEALKTIFKVHASG